MKQKRPARKVSLKRKSPPVFFIVIIILVLLGLAMMVIQQNEPRQLGMTHDQQVLGISSGFFDFFTSLFRKNNSSAPVPIQDPKLPEVSSGNREVGNAGEFYPYGEIKEDTVVEMSVSGKSGVVSAALSGNLTFYLIYPSNLPEGATLTLTPYYSMPTAKNSIPLSNELGYGLDIQWESSRHGELPNEMYAVFDLDQGKTIAEIRKNKKVSYFCDPTTPTFNPEACAYLNNVPLSEHTNKKYAVVAPIRSERLTHLASLERTVPIGYENLIVVPLSKETTLIPQKLSKELLADLIKGNGLSSQTTIYRTEAITHAIEQNIYTSENIEGIVSQYYGSNIYENIKLYYQLPKLDAFYKKIKAETNLSESEQLLVEKLKGSNYSYDQDITDNLKDLHLNVAVQFNDTNSPEFFINGAALIRRLEKEGIDMTAEKSQFMTRVVNDFDYYLEDDPGYVYTMLIATALLSPEHVALNKWDFTSQVFAQDGGSMSAQDIQDAIEDAIRKGQREMNRLCGDGAFVPPSSIERGLKFANMIGDDEGADRCQKKMCHDLDEAVNAPLGTPQDEAKNYVLFQRYCDDSEKKDEKWKNRTKDAKDKQECVTLIKKNLTNFADNRVYCRKFQDPDGGIDGYKGTEDVKRTKLRNDGESAPIDMDPGPGYTPGRN